MSSQLKLNPSAVRERAKSIPGCREVLAQGESVLSFMVMDNDKSNHSRGDGRFDSSINHNNNSKVASSLARVNIFVDSGTIGTSRVLDGKVRQTFRRNVQSLDVVERLLRYPEGPAEITEALIGVTDEDIQNNMSKDGQPMSSKSGAGSKISVDARLSSPQTVQKELELADVGLCILQGEREKLQKHLQCLEESRGTPSTQNMNNKAGTGAQTRASKQGGTHKLKGQRDTDFEEEDDPYDAASTLSSGSSVHGSEFQFKLPADVMKQVDQCLRDIAKMEKIVKGVATNGKGTVFLYGNGGVAYTPSIPKALYHKLRQLRSSSYASRPCFVALGTRDRYFVAFNDGSADWKGPSALDKILKKSLASAKLPRSVAFGSTYDTFFIVFHDGSWQYQGRGIPESLEEKLASRDDRADLVTVNLGPSGEWFLKAENGRMWWSGITEELDSVLGQILNDGYLHNMDFGENGSYFVSYDQE
mmetsp:Transcript_2240/g.3777  ORF Transcript_2240/g.3777 Transcript_2240/m.3777 type:complete len:474 (+) Transcript_2240:100-1521(+)